MTFTDVFEEEDAPKESQSIHHIRANSSIMQLKKILGASTAVCRGFPGLCDDRFPLPRPSSLRIMLAVLFANIGLLFRNQLPTVVKSVSFSLSSPCCCLSKLCPGIADTD